MRHLTDQQLIDLHYLAGSDEAASHIGECAECALRLRDTAGQLEQAAAAGMEPVAFPPDAFWHRQRLAIEVAIDRSARRSPGRRSLRWGAAAAVAALIAAGVLSVPRFFPSRTAQPASSVTVVPAPMATSTALDVIEDISSFDDPWDSEELQPFGAAVEWENWETDHHTRNNS